MTISEAREKAIAHSLGTLKREMIDAGKTTEDELTETAMARFRIEIHEMSNGTTAHGPGYPGICCVQPTEAIWRAIYVVAMSDPTV